MKIISWNVNGIRAVANKGFYDFFNESNADIFCIQETKIQEDQLDKYMKQLGQFRYWNSAEKKGYSGTAIFTKQKPISVCYGDDNEGRIITLEYDRFYIINCYTPNSKRELERLNYRMQWEDKMLQYLKNLNNKKPIIYCGDLNVAHEEIDLKNPSTNHQSAGFTDSERNKMTQLLNNGFIDSFRFLYPEKQEYSWWSYMFHAREKNIGWRIDYFIVSNKIKDKIIDSKIHTNIIGSDHCPIELDINI